jgi:hypothetical protein
VAELLVFGALVALIAAAGIALGMLAGRRLGAWDDRRARADAADTAGGPEGHGSGPAGEIHLPRDGGENGD